MALSQAKNGTEETGVAFTVIPCTAGSSSRKPPPGWTLTDWIPEQARKNAIFA